MLPAIKNNLKYIKNIFTQDSHVKQSFKRSLEEESDDEERERESEGKPTRKKQRLSSEGPPINRSYRRKFIDLVNGMTGLYSWISNFMSPRRREPPADVGVLAYGSQARIRMGGGSLGEVMVSPEEYVRGEVSPQAFTRADPSLVHSFPDSPLDNDEVQFMEVVKDGDLPRGRRRDEQPRRRPSLPRVPLQPASSLTTPSGIDASFRFTPTIDLTVDQQVQHRSCESSIIKSSQKPLSLRRRSEVVSKNPISSQYKPPGIVKRRSTNSLFSGRGSSCAQESFRFEDKMRYQQLLQQFTKSSVLPSSHGVYKSPSTPNSLTNGSTSSSADLITVSRLNPSWTKYKQQQLETKYNKQQQQIESKNKQHQSKSSPVTKSQDPDSPLSLLLSGSEQSSPLSVKSRKHGSSVSEKPPIPVIDLSGSERSSRTRASSKESEKEDIEVVCEVSYSPASSTLEKQLRDTPYFRSDWLKDLQKKYNEKSRKAEREAASKEILIGGIEERRRKDASLNDHLSRSLKHLDLTHPAKVVESVDDEEEALVELTPEMEDLIEDALNPTPGSEVLVERFNIQITRHDISTLAGLHWLNDEVINFYMNLIMERGGTYSYMSVYAFNTFFYPKLAKNGYTAVRRWTKKVDVFKYDLLLVPVHLGMHWCLATMDFKTRAIRYYDSMLGHNQHCLGTLIDYLESEHQDKKNTSYNTTGWKLEHMKDIPQQMNGSDCGMFTCKFAEYLSRGAHFTFGQEDMPYFRRRMVYEIVKGRLL